MASDGFRNIKSDALGAEMTGECRASVIIPCWNMAGYIGRAINSVLAQTYPHTEVIVIDDGSTDRSLEVIHSFGGRVRWETGPNLGGGAARNRGLDLALGEFVQFLDADDVLLPDKIARQAAMLEADPNQSVFGWYEHLLDGHEDAVAYRPPYALIYDDAVALALQHVIQIETPLHWTENVRRIGGFDERLPCNQDYDFNLRLACSGVRFCYDGEQSSRNVRRSYSVSSDECRRHKYMPRILENAYRMLKDRGNLTESRRTVLAHRLALVARGLIGCGDSELARDAIRLAFEIHPSGGVSSAYDSKSRLARAVLGPVWAERVIGLFRQSLGRKKKRSAQ